VGMLSNPRHTVFTNGRAPGPALAARVAHMGNQAITQRVVGLVADGGRLRGVRLADGSLHAADAGFVAGGFSSPASDVPAALGVGTAEHPFFPGLPACDEDGRTAVPGLYVAGDARVGFGGLVRALAQGAHAAAIIVADIAQERFGGP
jgi:thioredoxin reductase